MLIYQNLSINIIIIITSVENVKYIIRRALQNKIVSGPEYKDLGCWVDQVDGNANNKPSIPSIEHVTDMNSILDGNFEERNDPIKKCSQAASSLGYQVFALSEGECKASATAKFTYQMHGTSDTCNDHGTGGTRVNRVYELGRKKQLKLI